MASELNAILKKYLANLGKNEEAVGELTRNVRSWVVQNGEIVKEKIETQIDEAAVRMGFAKTSEIENLNSRIAELESRLNGVSGETSKSKREPTKSTAKKSSASKKVNSPSKKAAPAKASRKKVAK
jgi:polyhydroxyalkanoate synthesis regulator phasin